jgi:hypothetical protein
MVAPLESTFIFAKCSMTASDGVATLFRNGKNCEEKLEPGSDEHPSLRHLKGQFTSVVWEA